MKFGEGQTNSLTLSPDDSRILAGASYVDNNSSLAYIWNVSNYTFQEKTAHQYRNGLLMACVLLFISLFLFEWLINCHWQVAVEKLDSLNSFKIFMFISFYIYY